MANRNARGNDDGDNDGDRGHADSNEDVATVSLVDTKMLC